MKRILFITGTRADYGKMKPLMKMVDVSPDFDAYIYVSGMHLLKRLGSTYKEIEKDNYANTYMDFSQINSGIMSYDLGNIICNLTSYVNEIEPDLIVVHGDRIDALAGAVVGALSNIKVAHVEGGEISGTIDESIRHAISKFAHIHLVRNNDAKRRLIQLGEEENSIFIIGSPDIDVMVSDDLPTMENVRQRYEIMYDHYAILMYHPVTTELSEIKSHVEELVSAVIKSDMNYVVILPNNDMGSDVIVREYDRFKGKKNISVFPSIRFEYFLTMLKNAEFVIGNSSMGVYETEIYGVPTIDVGSRQNGRYDEKKMKNLQHVAEDVDEITSAIAKYKSFRTRGRDVTRENSKDKFMRLIEGDSIWNLEIQKHFVDIDRSTL